MDSETGPRFDHLDVQCCSDSSDYLSQHVYLIVYLVSEESEEQISDISLLIFCSSLSIPFY